MPDLQTMIQENREERERLSALMAGLKDGDFGRRLPNGWSVTVTLAHLAYWDLYQWNLLKRWLAEGGKPAQGVTDSRYVNDPLSVLSESISPQAVVLLAADAAEAIDRMVERLTPAQAEELLKMGLERTLHRALHRRNHLEKIEKALR